MDSVMPGEFKNTKKVNWKYKFFRTVPMVDAEGKPMEQNPPVTRGKFFPKRESEVKKYVKKPKSGR